jgi:transcriptional regulator with XRE-family HTH domain
MTCVNRRNRAPACCFHRCWRLVKADGRPVRKGRAVHLDVSTYQRVLGDEIRRLRKRRGWTRKDLNDRLQSDISLQTLATYELGTRQVSVVRFVEICRALEELPHELLARVHERVFSDATLGRIRVDLRKVVHDRAPELLPLRRWAAGRLAAQTGPQATEVRLDIAALEQMAELCGMETLELISRLRHIGAAPIGTPEAC